MKNITIIQPEKIQEKISNLFITKEFKLMIKDEMHQKDSFFHEFFHALSNKPIFLYEYSDDIERNHLTSFFRFLAKREYENPYIQDLYYFHELMHMAHYDKNQFFKEKDFSQWTQKLSDNELFSSLFSECFIYYIIPEIENKAFDKKWMNQFLEEDKNKEYLIDRQFHHFLVNSQEFIENKKINLFTTEKDSWPQSIQRIIDARNDIRRADFIVKNEEEEWIFHYNRLRDKWLLKWETHFENINHGLKFLDNYHACPEDKSFFSQADDFFEHQFHSKQLNQMKNLFSAGLQQDILFFDVIKKNKKKLSLS